MKYKLLHVIMLCSFAYAADINDVQNKIQNINQNSATSQNRIDKLDSQTKDYLQEYRSLISKLNTLKAYDKQLDGEIKSQEKEIKSFQEQIQSIEETKQAIFPLQENMVKAFGEFISMDTPFLASERKKRADDLKNLLEQSDVSLSEKYRRIMEAYKVEYDYSNNIEAYQDNLNINGKNIKVDFLRIGRVGLYYLSLDGLQGGYYDSNSKSFEPLDTKYIKNVKQALKIAKKHSAPNVLILPINSSRID